MLLRSSKSAILKVQTIGMIPEFPKRDWAFRLTDEWFQIERIEMYIKSIGTGIHAHMLAGRFESTVLAHREMKKEIGQFIHLGVSPDILAELFDPIVNYIKQWPFTTNYTDYASQLIEAFNTKWFGLKTELIDLDKSGFYFSKLSEVCASFIDNVKDYLKRYEEGKIGSMRKPETETKFIEIVSSSTPDKTFKLKVDITLEELAIFIRLLKECRVITSKTDKEIAAFLHDHFETKGLEGKPSSIKNIIKLFSSTDPDALNFWIGKFEELSKKAQKK